MSSRYGLWIICVCSMGLAGCANWQTRAGNTGLGNAAIGEPAGGLGAPVLAPATGVAPGTVFTNEPPPPMPPPPSAPGAMLAPLGSAPAPQRLDLSASTDSNDGPRPDRMYNLDGGPSRPSSSASSSSSKKSAGSSTLSKLASKAGTAKPASPAPKNSGASTVDRLREASTSSDSTNADDGVMPVRKAEEPSAAIVEPAPKVVVKPETAPAVDTTLLAQPVRKGSADDAKKDSDSSKGPQSRVVPGKTLFEKNKVMIYPVSSPAADVPVDITQFS